MSVELVFGAWAPETVYRFDDDPPRREIPFGSLEHLPERGAFRSTRRPRRLDPGDRARLRRDIVIAAAARGGCSQFLLAEVFGLTTTRIRQVLGSLDARPSPPSINLDDARTRKGRRDLVIAAAHEVGLSQVFLADVFGLDWSRVHRIIASNRPDRG